MLAVAGIDKKIMKVVRKMHIEKRTKSLLKDGKIRKQIKEKVIELVDFDVYNLWNAHKTMHEIVLRKIKIGIRA